MAAVFKSIFSSPFSQQPAPPATGFILQEDGFRILQEDDFYILID